jgi:hypothetical protein
MQYALELLFHFVVEILLYQTGKFFAPVLVPHLEAEKFDRQKIMPSSFKRQGFTYRRGKKRFLYAESIVFIGLLVWLIAGLSWFALSRLSIMSAFQSQLL